MTGWQPPLPALWSTCYHGAVSAGEPSPDLRTELADVAEGREDPGEVLVPQVYEILRSIAEAQMARERAGHTLQATALVHEAYLRLLGNAPVEWKSLGHFYAAAAEAMRRILIEHARAKGRLKRGGGRQRLPLSVADLASKEEPEQILAVDDAIRRLEESDAKAARIVKLRFFAGLTVEETARALGISERTVHREWAFARVRLFRFIEGRTSAEGG